MTRVIVTKPGVLSASDRKVLREAGIVPIVAENPDDVRFLQIEGEPLRSDDMLFAALAGVVESDFSKRTFAEVLFKLISAQRAKDTPQ